MEIKLYRKKGTTPMYAWEDGMSIEGISVSTEDHYLGSPKAGDMIAYNPDNPEDRWLVAKEYFEKHYELAHNQL